uniref:Uncharacterized protein n=1 Tax=Salix viminalis TaxID=40686 RepID=A0A6N2M614_SALVM
MINYLNTPKCSIYRVPKRLRGSREYAYTPQTVSIGPIHHGKEELKEMEVHKKLYLKEFLKLGKVSVEKYIVAIAERETRLRNCYADNFDKITSPDFVKMVLLDSSFIIVVLIVGAITEQMKRNDHVSLGLIKSLQEELKTLHAFSDKRSIYRVPKRLRGSREYAYTPPTVSIGPIHHGKEELKEMEVHKKLYLEEFLKLGKVSVEKYIVAIAERETRLRNCYADNFGKITSPDFVKMVLLDSSFIIVVWIEIVGATTEQMKRNDHVSLGIDKLTESLQEELKTLHAFSDKRSIYREYAYTPPTVSIGPIHHGKEELKEMEVHKKLYLEEFLKLYKVSVEKYIVAIAERETRLRNCYADNFGKITSPDFVKMVLLDSSFIIVALNDHVSLGIDKLTVSARGVENLACLLRQAFIYRVPKRLRGSREYAYTPPTVSIGPIHHGKEELKEMESLQEELKTLHAFSDKRSIYRVPKRLRGSREYAYTPPTVSIGPIHHGKEELKEMEVHKKLYLEEFLKLGKVSVEKYIVAIAERETRLRNCYADNFDKITSPDFVKMSLQEELKTLHAFSDKRSIYRVPKRLRGSREYAYTPPTVSIAPIHHGKEELKEMEVHKKLYLEKFLKLGKVSVEKYIVAIAERETRLRNCYADNFDKITSPDFVKMSLQEELKTLHAFSDKRSIYRVPKRLRGSREYAYTPPTVSIGPIHHGKEELKEMEGHKKLYLESFLNWQDLYHGMEIVGATTEQLKRNDHVSLGIDKLTESLQEELKTLHAFSDKRSIYRVPKRLRGSREYAYTPPTVSIGPIHHGKEELKEMEGHKKLYLEEFLKLGKVSVEKYIVAIAERETRLRNCYADNFDKITSPDFVKMVLLDSSFIIMEIVGATTEQMKRNDHVSLGIDKLTESLQEELKTLHAFSDKRSIYKVPKRLRGSREYAYTPPTVSIGPIHHGK